jgi:ATP adenylyltransferase
VRAEHWLGQARRVSGQALACGALVPLETRLLQTPGLDPFLLRELLSRPPRHLLEQGPRPNPFLPWDRPLEVARLGGSHVLLLNKYPVQPNHLLVISQGWKPQDGWLEAEDWAAVATVAADTDGLWFFNSQASAGASQPHRHLQILPRSAGEASCPLAPLLNAQLRGEGNPWPWAYRLSRRGNAGGPQELAELYRLQARDLGLGSPEEDGSPRHAYNLLFDDQWFMTVCRRREHEAGFSINALGFAGFLLCTGRSDRGWLERNGPWALLSSVAAAGEGRVLELG